jgi:hypothetical protein
MIIASVIVGLVCLWVIKRFDPEGPAAKLLWVIFFSCVGNIIFVLLFGDITGNMTKTTIPDLKQYSLQGSSGISVHQAEGTLPAELK